MQMLYDSDDYIVVHMDAHDGEGNPHNKGRKPRHGFEIVNKKSNMEIYLDGDLAAIFQRQINAWQVKTPTQEEVDETLCGYTQLAQAPLVMH
jgi:hypothetical protein